MLLSFTSLSNDGIQSIESVSHSIESSVDIIYGPYPGGKTKKNRRHRRANKKRNKQCKKMHRMR